VSEQPDEHLDAPAGEQLDDPVAAEHADHLDEPAAAEYVDEEPVEQPDEQPAEHPDEQRSGQDGRSGADATGARIAAAVDRLDSLAERPPAEHVEVYEEVHSVLQDSLAQAQGDEQHQAPGGAGR